MADRDRVKSPTPPGDTHRIDSLTGLRIVAAGAVFLSHLAAPSFIANPVSTFMSAGYNGVTLFFTLSGFVLAWNYADRLARPSSDGIWTFAVARFARIYPLYLFALLWASAPALVSHTLPDFAWLHVLTVQTWSSDVLVAFGLNGPGWSIGVEFFLYACFPFLALAIGPVRRRPWALLSVALLALAVVGALAWWFTHTGRAALPSTDPASAHRWLYRTPLTRLGDFTVGMCAALLIRAVRIRPWVGLAFQVAALLAFGVLMVQPRLLNSAWSWDFAYLLPTAALIWGLAAAPRTSLSRALATRPMVLAGEASFAFYLLHQPLLGRLSIGPVDRWYGWAFTVALEFTIILMVAIGAHTLVERPAQRWIRSRFIRRDAATTVNARPVPALPVDLPALTTDGRAPGRSPEDAHLANPHHPSQEVSQPGHSVARTSHGEAVVRHE